MIVRLGGAAYLSWHQGRAVAVVAVSGIDARDWGFCASFIGRM